MTHFKHRYEEISDRLKKLTEANRSLAEIESLDDLFPQLLNLAKEVMVAEAALIFLYNPESRLLEIVSRKDDLFADQAAEFLNPPMSLKLGEGMAGWVGQHRRAVMIEDAQNDPRFSKAADRQRNWTTRTLLAVPLVQGEKLLGVLAVLNSRNKAFFDHEDLALLESFGDLTAIAIVRSRLLKHRIEQKQLQAELWAAARIQKLFWPKLPELGEGSHVWASSIPAASVGGDLYDVIPMPDGSWLVYVADISGKGLPASLMMAALSAKVRSIAPLHRDVRNLLAHLNNEMHELMSAEGFFATMALAKYWPVAGRLQLARAGHPYPLWITAHGLRDLPKLDGISVGIDPGAQYGQADVALLPGDTIVFLTDGVTEAVDEKGELFGNKRLSSYLREADGPPWAEGILRTIGTWRGNAAMNDDLTILEIWREPRVFSGKGLRRCRNKTG